MTDNIDPANIEKAGNSGQHETAEMTFGDRVKKAVIWRSGTQILSQIIAWAATLIVIRILVPADYGLFAMSQVVVIFLTYLSGYGFVSAIIQKEDVEEIQIRQAFGMLLIINISLAILQICVAAPLAAAYYQQPMIADMLRWQSLILLATPFTILPEAMMTRNLEFKKPAIVNCISAVVGASVSLVMAFNGYGVWTLVVAPITIFWSRAIALFALTRFWVNPSFNFAGAGHMFTYGWMIMVSHLLWIFQSQSDIFISGRFFDKHQIGLYAQAMFITTIFASKFVPPLNEVAFPAYARLQNDRAALSHGFLKAVRMIMLISCPLYFGLAVTAEPFVDVVLGPKWIEAAPLIAILSFAMPVMTLQILFHPALNGLGLPHIYMRNSFYGALIMPICYIVAVQFGVTGLAWAWLVAFPLLTIVTFVQSRHHIGITATGLFMALRPALLTSTIMAFAIYALDRFLLMSLMPQLSSFVRLPLLTAMGGAVYVGLLWVTARETFVEVVQLVIKRKPPKAEEAAEIVPAE